MPDIAQSVGVGGVNDKADVTIVQKLLNRHVSALGLMALTTEGNLGPKTIATIKAFQTAILGVRDPNGRADPAGRTITALNAPVANNLSGAAWWHANQARYANSAAISDLAPEFREPVARFIAAMRAAGATVTVTSTLRNKTRAYLMHYCWAISRGEISPADVPAEPGCSILWDHISLTKSTTAAREMRELFDLVHEPSLRSRHIEGKAIDMAVVWRDTIKIKDADGRVVSIDVPIGNSNTALHKVGASYGVIKLLTDAPHWSSDGA